MKNPSNFNDHGWNIFVSSPVKQWPRTRFECVSSFTMTAVLKSFLTCSSPCSKDLQITSKLLAHAWLQISKASKTSGKFLMSYFDLLSKFGEKSFQEYVSEGISHPVLCGDLVYKLRRVKCEANFVSSGSKIVKRIRRRKYDQVIIARTICLLFGPSTALYRIFLKHCTLTRRWIYMTGLVQTSSEETRPRSSSGPSDC